MKFFAHLVMTRRVDFKILVRTGGMPSSHSASVSALSTCVGLNEGFTSTLFAVTLFFSLIVMYDAAGLRRAAGKQAEILNRLVDHHYPRQPVREERLLELLGHTPLEVLVGAVLGVAYALVWY
jgi:acid phosphatase family membrane protein YuiD